MTAAQHPERIRPDGKSPGEEPVSRNSPATAPLPAGTAADGPGTDDSPELATLSDEQLLLRFRAAGGSAAAAERAAARAGFDELFARYRQPLWGFFRRRLDDAARAEELAQETFLVVLRNAARWEPRASFRSWLYGIALKLVAAERRRNSHRREAPLTTVDPPAAGADLDAVLAVRAAVAGWVGLRESAVGLVDFILRYSLALVFWAALVALPLRWAVRRFRRPEGVEDFSDTPAHS
jgi:RNA polymerase sigma factor (sigma-70 family)